LPPSHLLFNNLLKVDNTMSITLNTKVFAQDRISADTVEYVGPSHSLTNTQKLVVSRTYPKPVGSFGGMARPKVQIVLKVPLNGGTTDYALMSLTLTGAIPVGAADADISTVIADMVDVLQLEEAGTTKIIKKLDILE